MLTKKELVEGFKSLGLKSGDTVLVHSSYKSLGGVQGGPQIVIDSLLETIGQKGTLIMPAFNFDFCKGATWDYKNTPSHMGIITELVRNNPESTRVFHPIYSFSILGQHKETLGEIHNRSAYGADSLFAQLRMLDAKIMVIGLDYTNSMTYFHHIEEMEGVNYRYMKDFTGEIIDREGNSSIQTYSMLVRDIDMGVVTEVNPMGKLLEEAGIIRKGQIGEAEVAVMKAKEVYEFTAKEMRRDPFLLYQIDFGKA